MSEQETIVNEQPVEEPAAEAETTASNELLDELSQFGEKLSAAIQQAWASEQRQEVEQEIREGLKTAGDRLDDVAEELRGHERTKDIKEQAAKVMDAVEESNVTQEVRKGLLSGLRKLNDELNKLLSNKEADVESEAETVVVDAEAETVE